MGVVDIVIVSVVVLAVVAVIGVEIYKRITGKSNGCDCGCSGGACSHCAQNKRKDNSKK